MSKRLHTWDPSSTLEFLASWILSLGFGGLRLFCLSKNTTKEKQMSQNMPSIQTH